MLFHRWEQVWVHAPVLRQHELQRQVSSSCRGDCRQRRPMKGKTTARQLSRKVHCCCLAAPVRLLGCP